MQRLIGHLQSRVRCRHAVNLLFSELGNIIGYSRSVRYGPGKADETFKIYLDSRRAQRDLGWRPMVGLLEGLSRTVAYFREHKRRG
jgi:nucleoside-diphosphate-sugar epimerase